LVDTSKDIFIHLKDQSISRVFIAEDIPKETPKITQRKPTSCLTLFKTLSDITINYEMQFHINIPYVSKIYQQLLAISEIDNLKNGRIICAPDNQGKNP